MTDEPDEGRDPQTGRFVEGNRFWEHSLNAFRKNGPLPMFTDPDDLIDAAAGYFADITDNPLFQEKAWQSEGAIVTHESPLARVMTIQGLCNHLGITRQAWEKWRAEREDLIPAIRFIEQIMEQHKIELASAGLAQQQFIARLMGLADVKEHAGPGGGAIEIKGGEDWSDMDRARRLAFLMAKAIEDKKEQEQTDGDSSTDQGPE